jgi:hypothetical protein
MVSILRELQAPLVIAELKAKRWWRELADPTGLRTLPKINAVLARAATSLVLLSIATPLFFTPADIETDLGARMLAALQQGNDEVARRKSKEEGTARFRQSKTSHKKLLWYRVP